ncbi:HAD-IC family P-type ATPase, partial [Patescibacteria group bacterium]|nr:HAD-IC family P-type ATPase [Patescibacteria group bacterium]
LLPEKPPPSKFSIFIDQLKSPLVYVLLLAALVTFFIKHTTDALIILIAVGINTVLGFVQENKTSNALSALKQFISVKTTVLRDSDRQTIETKFVVPGDIVFLKQGDKVAADGVLISSNRFYVNEAMLTGESVPVEKDVNDIVFKGTTVSSGQAVFKVEKTGAYTEMGKIADKIQDKQEITPFQKQLKKFSHQLLIVIGLTVAIVFIIGIIRGIDLAEIFVTSVALAVSSIPEGLLVSLTVVLTIGMQKILKRKGLVRKLAAAETLGGVSVICCDKTGTLTIGQMEVANHSGDEKQLAEQAMLANDLDDPIVISSYKWAENVIQDPSASHKRLDSIPFSSKEKFFTCLNRWDENSNMVFVNGAPEMILKWTDLPKEEKENVIKSIEELTQQGKRVLGFARKKADINKNKLEIKDAKEGLTWVGILAFSDPVRVGLAEDLKKTREAGIKTVVITGDYANTSKYVLSQLGIDVLEGDCITGEELSNMDDDQLSQNIHNIKLFARTSPDQKLRIVEAFKREGEVVAMIGDGVNDAPALHRSDIGVVVNEASDVSKESADLVLLDSSFATIVSAIEEGRAMFENIRKIILYLLCDAFGEIVIVLGGIIFGLPLPLTAVQILWINLVSDGFPNLSLTIDPKRDDIMQEKPRSSKENIVTGWMIGLIVFVSVLAGLIAFGLYTYTIKTTGDEVLARSFAFVTMGVNSLIYVFSVRAPKTSFWKSHMFENKWLIISVIAGFGLQYLPFSTTMLREFFKVTTLGIRYWGISIFFSIILFFIVEIFKHIYRPKIVGTKG